MRYVAVMKKELVRTFTDLRSLGSLIAMPLIFLLVMWLYSKNFASASSASAAASASSSSLGSALLPMLIMVMIASSVQVTVPSAIAGEKERKTLSAILMTPIKKWEYLLGKVLALVIIGLLSASISFCIIAFALPALLGFSIGYSVGQYLMLFLLTFLTVLFSTMLMVSWSLEAKSLRQAMGDASIFATFMMIIPFLTRSMDTSEEWVSFAPFINITVAFVQVSSGEAVDVAKMAIILVSTFVYSLAFFGYSVYLSSKEGVLA
jgi:sodium transport system permease protein